MSLDADWLVSAGVAVPLFMATNADDLVLLMIFFADARARISTVVTGQLAGMGVLTIVSLLAARLAVQLPETWIPLLGLVPLALGFKMMRATAEAPPAALGWWSITAITVANGSDNLGAYIPVFAVQSVVGLAVIAVMFGLLTVAWCSLAHWLVRHPAQGHKVRRVTQRFAPFVLILVGLWIMAGHPAWPRL
jgi:cadmium resistance protein CadD (predicted permease)